MALVSNFCIIYPLNMKGIKFILFAIIFAFALQLNSAEPHALNDFFPGYPFYYTIDLIVRKNPIKYSVTDGVPKENHYKFPGYFQVWFNNILTRLEQPNAPQKEELKDFLDIIKFGAADSTYIPARYREADIGFIFTKGVPQCHNHWARACFQLENPMKIFMDPVEYSSQEDFTKSAIHEIGHSLRLEDLYESRTKYLNPNYGNGIKDSIMKTSAELTCDDADAIVNAIWLAHSRLAYEKTPDLEFTSFCNPNVKFKNAKQKNRPAISIESDNFRYVFDYCKDGSKHSETIINTTDIKNLYSKEYFDSDCDFIPSAPFQIKKQADINYEIRDFKSGKVLESKKYGKNPGLNIYLPLPESEGILLTVSIGKKLNGRIIPGYIKVTDEKNELRYLLAYLPDFYNMVYSKKGNNETFFIYKRFDHNIYYNIHKDNNSKEDKNNEMDTLLRKYFMIFLKENFMTYPYFNEFTEKDIIQAEKWEDYLLENYPKVKALSDISLFGKAIEQDPKGIVLKRPF